MQIGYARVSTQDQNLDLQRLALQQAGCELIIEEKLSGSRFNADRLNAARPGLQEAIAHLQPGGTLTVWKLDRLGRGVKGLITLVGDLEAQGFQFRSLTESIDTSSPAGRLFFHILAAMGQLEQETTIQRTRAGLEAARLRGRIGGRRRVMTDGKIESAQQLLASGMPPKEVARNLGISIPTLYRWLPASRRN